MEKYYNSYPMYMVEIIIKSIILQDFSRIETEIINHQEYEKSIDFSLSNKKMAMVTIANMITKDLVKNSINAVKIDELTSKICNKIISFRYLEQLYDYEMKMFVEYFEFYRKEEATFDNMLVYRVLNYLHYNYLDSVKLENMHKDFNYSQNYLNRVFKDVTGKTIKQHIQNLKMERAEFLLKYSSLSMLEISVELDYYDVAHFSKMFKKKYDVSPSEYKKKHRV